MSAGRTASRWLKKLGPLHLLGLAVPALFLPTALFHAVLQGFDAPPGRYGRVVIEPEPTVNGILNSFVQRGRDLRSMRAAVWGLAETPGGAPARDSAGSVFAEYFLRAGMRVTASDPSGPGAAGALFGPSLLVEADPYAAARGADVLVIACEDPAYAQVDFARLRGEMRGALVFDAHNGVRNPDGAFAEGLRYVRLGSEIWPFWKDRELRAFAEAAASAVPEDASVLFLPANRVRADAAPASDRGRSRHFLWLNYALFPRRLLLPDPVPASGTLGQYADWVANERQAPLLPADGVRALGGGLGAGFVITGRINAHFYSSEWSLEALAQEDGGP